MTINYLHGRDPSLYSPNNIEHLEYWSGTEYLRMEAGRAFESVDDPQNYFYVWAINLSNPQLLEKTPEGKPPYFVESLETCPLVAISYEQSLPIPSGLDDPDKFTNVLEHLSHARYLERHVSV